MLQKPLDSHIDSVHMHEEGLISRVEDLTKAGLRWDKILETK